MNKKTATEMMRHASNIAVAHYLVDDAATATQLREASDFLKKMVLDDARAAGRRSMRRALSSFKKSVGLKPARKASATGKSRAPAEAV